MGRRQVRVIAVRRWVSGVMLVLTTAGMVALLYVLSGRAYASEGYASRELIARVGRGEVGSDAILALLMPLLGNVLLFIPWGFLTFVMLDTKARPRSASYLLTVAGAAVLATGMFVWQQVLPTRVTAWPDVLANAAGALAGASLAHARKTVQVRFDF